MTPDQDKNLVIKILDKLYSIELELEPGASVLVQPELEMHQEAIIIKIPGYDYNQVDRKLREMILKDLVNSGGPAHDSVGIGIYFNSLTPRGRQILGK